MVKYLRNYKLGDSELVDNNIITDRNFIKTLPFYKTILDVGCGLGRDMRVLKKLYPACDISGIDLVNYSFGEYPGKFYVGSVLKLPFKDKVFDLAYANIVFCHLDQDEVEQALQEMCRVAKQVVYTEIYKIDSEYGYVVLNGNSRT